MDTFTYLNQGKKTLKNYQTEDFITLTSTDGVWDEYDEEDEPEPA